MVEYEDAVLESKGKELGIKVTNFGHRKIG